MPVQPDLNEEELLDILLDDYEDEDAAIQNTMIQHRAILQRRNILQSGNTRATRQGPRLRIF
ncbi:uncharacterized protein MELLADRAFT_88727 [Melampsora larici-populina 98AG31]|uniref:Uncharacterized protein n=1 Tax=Melampsora larici-populina (strain 98AG31 / pathotype 3-4-7) TaxID=747676 RepID=F4RSS5_MELLP|nr:uncharacterized protein MELLADRAFT_88727 [Melampsora larici-populina 98AG31]EGG04384.1 hypothetical protein MELLADRAFT_88727 [Melampsora larici-populina 98AG31]